MTLTIGDFIGVHRGRAALILGGGPSLQSDIDVALRCVADPVRYAIKHHAARIGLTSDYVCFSDSPALPFYADLPPSVPRISHHPSPWSTIRLTGNVPDFGGSSANAVWVAQLMGCDPVVLAGMDCYRTPAYCYDINDHPRAAALRDQLACDTAQFDGHVQRWRRAIAGMWLPGRVYGVSGPLVGAGIVPNLMTRPI